MTTPSSQKGSTGLIIVAILALLIAGALVAMRSKGAPAPVVQISSSTPVASEAMHDDYSMASGTEEDMMGSGVVFMNGKISLEEGKKMTPLTKEYVFDTGVQVSLTGLVTMKDGKTVQLKEGDSAWGDGSVMKAGDMMDEKPAASTMKATPMDTMMAKVGTYEAFNPAKISLASSGKVVLFFHASWCPTCRALDADIKAHSANMPAGLTILDVDYDTSATLKKQYGITTQHTFVQVDAKGNMIKKWSGSPTLAVLASEVK